MLSLETEDIMPAAPHERAEAREDGVDIRPGWGPKEVLTADGKVTGIIFKKCTSVFDAEHRFAPTYDEEQLLTLDADMVIFAIGQAIQNGALFEGSKVEFGRGNKIPLWLFGFLY